MKLTEPLVRRILVAEDNEDHRFLTVRALSSHSNGIQLEVDAVRDGEEVLDYIYRRGRFVDRPRPHLILLDIKMPKVTGLEVLERLKADPELKTIPIVVLTSSDRPEDVEAAYRLGTNSYVTKPATMTGIREGIAGVTDFWVERVSLPEPPK